MDALIRRRGRQIHNRGNETGGSPAPSLASRQWIAEVGVDRVIVTVGDETATRGQDVGKGIGADFDLQHASIISLGGCVYLQIVVVRESQLGDAQWKRYCR